MVPPTVPQLLTKERTAAMGSFNCVVRNVRAKRTLLSPVMRERKDSFGMALTGVRNHVFTPMISKPLLALPCRSLDNPLMGDTAYIHPLPVSETYIPESSDCDTLAKGL